MRDSEVGYTTEAILANPQNESPWRYLRGLYKGDTSQLISDNRVSELCLKVLKTGNSYQFALSLLLDLLCYGFQPSEELRAVVEALRNSEQEDTVSSNLAATVCLILEITDPMRLNYWVLNGSGLPSLLYGSKSDWTFRSDLAAPEREFMYPAKPFHGHLDQGPLHRSYGGALPLAFCLAFSIFFLQLRTIDHRIFVATREGGGSFGS
ncbi:hypothetical protein BHE74_00043653 [Ensete ventricosum]|uniref:Uncharacterized protein n=1 Tax=Ensete ventricosum TaxID=4639 RepID=A0A426Z3M6_ENSVE|nr:hypothetical protein B296_00044226 [Ensete ventricosum]RWW50118.1 hypothetical protein BHE74_00043653 [Ensete ventricosum]